MFLFFFFSHVTVIDLKGFKDGLFGLGKFYPNGESNFNATYKKHGL